MTKLVTELDAPLTFTVMCPEELVVQVKDCVEENPENVGELTRRTLPELVVMGVMINQKVATGKVLNLKVTDVA